MVKKKHLGFNVLELAGLIAVLSLFFCGTSLAQYAQARATIQTFMPEKFGYWLGNKAIQSLSRKYSIQDMIEWPFERGKAAMMDEISAIMASESLSIESLIDLIGVIHEGPGWRILSQDLDPKKGFLKLCQSKWLMYFLHWRPLTKTNKTLSVDYVRSHMLNFWGQSMNFKLLGIDGEVNICGHKAIFTEGTVMDGAIYTRFIVWNCTQTNRQFTADCNINLRRKTPQDLLDLQRAISQTICCHKDASPYEVPAELTQRYLSKKWNISFFIPSTWRTADYVSKEWFPHGMSAQSGSLWTLPTDSLKRLDLSWEIEDEDLSKDVFKRFMRKCAVPFVFENVTSRISKWKLKEIKERDSAWIGEGLYEFKQKAHNQETVFPFRFRGFLWKVGKKAYFLLASMAQIKEFWNIPNDLSPSDETFENFVEKQVLPNIKVLPSPGRSF